jgi:hypothetical protein
MHGVALAEPGSEFTARFEHLAIDLLRECSATGAAGMLRLTWDETWRIERGGRLRASTTGATHSRLAPMEVVAQLNRRHLSNALTYVRHSNTVRA